MIYDYPPVYDLVVTQSRKTCDSDSTNPSLFILSKTKENIDSVIVRNTYGHFKNRSNSYNF